ncbi:MAG: class I SAM-dependent methyltransferase [Terriglobia bacterium]
MVLGMGYATGAKKLFYDLTAGRDRRLAIRELRRLERKLPSSRLRFAVPFVFRSRGHYKSITPIQTPSEIEPLYLAVCDLKPRCVVEVGTALGGTLYLWTQAATEDATIVSIDLPAGLSGGGYLESRSALYKAFARPRQNLYLLRANSHDPQTLQQVRRILGDHPVDLLFIDADHTYEGVKTDFILYGPLVQPGGLIAFHDIRPSPDPQIQVERLWTQLRGRYDVKEFVYPDRWGRELGIGLLRVPAGGLDGSLPLE